MKKNLLAILLVTFTLMFVSPFINAQSQCPWGRVNCQHGCGRFLDDNKNGFCDFSEVNKMDTPEVKTTVVKKEAKVTKKNAQTADHKSDRCTGCPHDKCIESETSAAGSTAETAEDDEFKSMDAEVDTTAISKAELEATTASEKKKPYSLILISALTLVLYFFTWLAAGREWIKLSTHRRFWNLLLLATFLVSCLFGFFLVIQINYDFVIGWYRTVLYWHVQVGIAMTLIAVFHTIWHTKYYVNIFKRKKTPKE
jgi:cation transport ATPase